MFGTYIWMLRCTSTCSIHNLHSWSIRCPRDGLFVPLPSGLQFPEPLSRDVDYLFGTNEFNGRIPDMFKICAPPWRFGFVWWNLRNHPEQNPMVDHQFAFKHDNLGDYVGLCPIYTDKHIWRIIDIFGIKPQSRWCRSSLGWPLTLERSTAARFLLVNSCPNLEPGRVPGISSHELSTNLSGD
jgi:hypothetical protein